LDKLEERIGGSTRSIVIGISENDPRGNVMAVRVGNDRIVRQDGEAREAFICRVYAYPVEMIVLFGKDDVDL